MIEKLGVGNFAPVADQTNIVTIGQDRQLKLVYSDPLPSYAHFQGRTDELKQIKQWLRSGTVQIIGVGGEGGIGKSTLAAKAFADSVGFEHKCWLDVRTGKPLAIAAQQALSELGLLPQQVEAMKEKDLPDRLLRALQQDRCLLAIDNLESVLTKKGEWQLGSGYGEFLAKFSNLGSQSVLLLASREYPPGYFGWLHFKSLSLNTGLKPDEGAALLVALQVEGSQENLEAVSQQVYGNPLALSLMAGWLRESYKEGERQISHLQHQDLFQIVPKYQGESQISVEAVLRWSWDRLDNWQQQLLKRVSMLQDDFTADLAAALMKDSDLELAIDNWALRDLERRSLLQEMPKINSEASLFRLQPRLREWVQNQAGDVDLKAAHLAAIQYFQGRLITTFTANDSLEATYPHRAIFYHWKQLKEYDRALEILDLCQGFLFRRGYYNIFLELHQQSLAISREIGDRNGEGSSLIGLGNAYQSLGEYQKAIYFHQQSLAIKREIGDRNGEGSSLIGLGNAYQSLGEYQKARDFHQQSLAIFQQIGDRYGEGNSLNNLGNAYDSLGEYQKAIDFYQQSLDISREIGDRNGEGISLGNLGNPYRSLGEYQKAIDFYQQSLAISREIGDRYGEGRSLNNLGSAYRSLGEYQKAIDFYQQSLDISREIGDRDGEGNSLIGLGNAYQSLGEYQKAIDFYQQSLDISREIGDRYGEGSSLNNLGNAYYFLGEYQKAIDFHQQSLDISREIGDRYGEGSSLNNLGNAYYFLGEYQKAADYYQQSQKIFQELQLPHLVEQCQTLLANCHPPTLASRFLR